MSRRPYDCLRRIMVLLLVAPVWLACAGSTSRQRRAPLPEDALATAMLLTLADFDSGWIDHPPPALPRVLEPCRLPAPDGLAGRAATGFSHTHGESPRAVEYVYLFDTAERAATLPDAYLTVGQCYADHLNRGQLDTAGWRYTQTIVSRVDSPAYGDHADEYRFQDRVTAKRSGGLALQGFDEVVIFVVGRVVVEVSIETYGAPNDAAATNLLVGAALVRVRQQLAR